MAACRDNKAGLSVIDNGGATGHKSVLKHTDTVGALPRWVKRKDSKSFFHIQKTWNYFAEITQVTSFIVWLIDKMFCIYI